jgi:excisionase family DNA binding protein
MSTQILTTKQAAKYLGVSASFLEKDRWRGARIPFVRVGRRAIRYRETDLSTFLENQTFGSTSEYAHV